MSNYAISLKRTASLAAAMALLAALTLVSFSSFLAGRASAAQMPNRSLTLSSTLPGDEVGNGVAGDETNGSDVTYVFGFTVPNASEGNIGSMDFEFCTNAVGTCDPLDDDENLDLSGATLSGSTGVSGFSLGTGDGNTLEITKTPGAVSADTAVTVTFDGIVNPDVVGEFFVRITTYSDDAYSTAVDNGTVASAISEGIYITARVAETLGFSTTGSFAGVGDPTESCDPVTGSGAITLGDPTEHTLSITTPYDNYSAFRVYTNAANGVSINYEGETLTHSNDSDTITAVATGVASNDGNEQFGLGVDIVNGGDGNSSEVTPASIGSAIELQYVDSGANFGGAGQISIDDDYNDAAGTFVSDGSGTALFSFAANTVTEIASATSYVLCNTAAVRYLANIAPTTAAGTYTTTIVYSAVPTY